MPKLIATILLVACCVSHVYSQSTKDSSLATAEPAPAVDKQQSESFFKEYKDPLLNGLFGILGVCLGGAITWYQQRRKGKREYAFELQRELNNVEMSRARYEAFHYIEQHPELSLVDLEKLHGPQLTPLYILLRFYQRLWLAIHYKNIHTTLVKEIFPEIFYYWHYIYFKDNVPSDWLLGKHMHALAAWFEANMPAEEHKALMEKRLAEREKLIEAAKKMQQPAQENEAGAMV